MEIFSFLSIFCFISSFFCPKNNHNETTLENPALDVNYDAKSRQNLEKFENNGTKLQEDPLKIENDLKMPKGDAIVNVKNSTINGIDLFSTTVSNVLKSEENGKEAHPAGEEPQFGLLRVMTFNTLKAGTLVEDGIEKIGRHIRHVDADIVLLQEMRQERLKPVLEELGDDWDGVEVDTDQAVITKHKILDKKNVSLTPIAIGASIHIQALDLTVNAISVHLNFRQYGPYEFAFGNGTIVEHQQRALEGDVNGKGTGRLEQMEQLLSHDFVKNSLEKAKNGQEIFILGGDFNEPSHFDWTEDTKHQHYGFIYEWPVTKRLAEAGMIDSFRRMHPDEAEEPGNTWSPIQKETEDGTGAHEPQDRIDFIFYASHRMRPVFSFLYAGNYTLNEMKPNHQANDWPSDHAAVVTDFEVF